MLLHAIVHAADIQDRDGGALLLATLFGLFPFLKKLFADSAYQGPIFHKAIGKILTQLDIDIVKRSDQAKGFVVLPKLWIVERTIAWLNRCRRLAKDWENLNVKALAFLRFASIRLMLRLRRPLRTNVSLIRCRIGFLLRDRCLAPAGSRRMATNSRTVARLGPASEYCPSLNFSNGVESGHSLNPLE